MSTQPGSRAALRTLAWLGNRALGLCGTLWFVATIAFFLMRSVPGSPFSSERVASGAALDALRERYHLDWPIWKQYLQYVGPVNLDPNGLFGDRSQLWAGVLSGDLGPSLRYRDFSVADVIGQSLPVSLQLGALALLFAVVVGVLAGLLSALRPRSVLDLFIRVSATAGLALPNFVIATLLLALFAFTLSWFPVAGWDGPRHRILPAVALGAPFAAAIARLVRTGMLDVLSQDWIRTARAKGLPQSTLLLRHALTPALMPVISYLGPTAAGVLTGSLVVERIFFVPGAGSHFVESALNRDYALSLGLTLVYTALVYSFNALVDLAYRWLDPRVRSESALS